MNAILEAVLNGWWQGIVLTLIVWLVLRDLPRISAATRLAIWHVTLLIVLLLPMLQRIPVPSWVTAGPALENPVRRAPSRPPGATDHAPPAKSETTTASPAIRQPWFEFSGQEGAEMLAGIALLLAAFQLLRLLIGYAAVRRLKRKSTPSGLDVPVRLGRAASVLVSDRIGMPMAVGYCRPAILLPRSLVAGLTPEQLRHVLLHESAHLLRRDDWMALAERVIRAVFFFQPAVYWIGRQIEREREIACDDWVIAQAGEPVPYVKSLARVAELGSARARVPMLATGAGRPKAIFARVETLLDRTRNRLPSVSEPLVIVAGLLILFAVSQGAHFNHLVGLTSYSSRWVESDGVNRREMKLRGEVHFSPGDQDVESMSPGARLVVEQSDAFRSRMVDFAADDTGQIRRRYFTDGTERPFNDEARRFLARILPLWVREQGIDIPERLSRMVREHGVDRSLEDVRAIRADHVKRQYLEELFVQATLNEWQLSRVLKVAGEIGSDYEKRRFFESVRDRYDQGRLGNQALGFIDSIQSDDDRRHLLAHAIEQDNLDKSSLPRVMRSVSRIGSDDAKTSLLMKTVQASRVGLPEEFFEAASAINSDDGRARVLSTAIVAHTGDPKLITQALRSAAAMSSDGEKARTLLAAASGVRGKPDVMAEASRVLASMHSDGDRRRVIEALLAADGENAESQRELLLQTSTIGSDGDKAHILIAMADSFIEEDRVRRPFFSAVNTLHSSGDQRRVLTRVLARTPLSRETLGEVTLSAAQINSDDDQAAVLKAIASRR